MFDFDEHGNLNPDQPIDSDLKTVEEILAFNDHRRLLFADFKSFLALISDLNLVVSEIWIDGSFATWVGTLVPSVNQELLIVAEPGREEEVITRLSRVGYDHALGYLKGGYPAWKNAGKESDEIISVSVQDLESIMQKQQVNVLDVRKVSEHYSEHIIDSVNAPLDSINDSMSLIDKNKTYYVHCAGGYRSMIFISILRARGFNNLVDVRGGFSEIKKSDKFKLSEYVCPTTML